MSTPATQIALHNEAMRALNLCRRADPTAGLEIYRQALRNGGVRILPVGLHARMLTDAGLGSVAKDLLLLGLENGADISLHGASIALLGRRDQQKIRDEYLDLFRRGLSDTVMVERYLAVCQELGDESEIAAILDSRLIRLYNITNSGNPEVNPHAVAAAVLRAAQHRPFEGSLQALRHSQRLDSIDCLPDTAITNLISAIRASVIDYHAGLPADTHPAVRPASREFRLETWCVISQGDGYTVPHVHPRGWLTGVFYAAAPTEAYSSHSEEGALCIGRQDFISDMAPGWQTLKIAPVPGRLVLMPSYAQHWTNPLTKPGLRISIAIDVCTIR